MTMMKYKGYVASIEIDVEDELSFGEVKGLRDTITFQGRTVDEVVRAFHESIDLYLLTCREQGIKPDRPLLRWTTIGLGPQVHRTLFGRALKRDQSLDQLIAQILTEEAARTPDDDAARRAARRAAAAARQGRKGKVG